MACQAVILVEAAGEGQEEGAGEEADGAAAMMANIGRMAPAANGTVEAVAANGTAVPAAVVASGRMRTLVAASGAALQAVAAASGTVLPAVAVVASGTVIVAAAVVETEEEATESLVDSLNPTLPCSRTVPEVVFSCPTQPCWHR